MPRPSLEKAIKGLRARIVAKAILALPPGSYRAAELTELLMTRGLRLEYANPTNSVQAIAERICDLGYMHRSRPNIGARGSEPVYYEVLDPNAKKVATPQPPQPLQSAKQAAADVPFEEAVLATLGAILNHLKTAAPLARKVG